MKKLFRTLAIITLFKLLLLPAFSSQCLAQSAQIGITTDLLSNDKPVSGVLGIEMGPARVTAGSGYDHRGEGAFDLIARNRDGIYFGVGLFSEVVSDLSEYATSDSSFTPHPGKGHGKGLKKKSRKGGKVITRTFSFRGNDYSAYPSALIGVAGRHTYFESRLIFGTNDIVSAQASIGVRF